MQKITNHDELKRIILDLELEQSAEWTSLKADILYTSENFNLINAFKSILVHLLNSMDLKANTIDTAIGLTTGFLAKKTIIGKTNNPFKILLSQILEMTVANKIANNAEAIKTIGGILINKFMPSKNENKRS